MMKKKSHPEFVRALKARNLKITVVGTYEIHKLKVSNENKFQ